MHPGRLAVLLGLALLAIAVTSVGLGPSSSVELGEVLRGALSKLHLCAPLDGSLQVIAELRLYKLLVSIGVGAALDFGALLVDRLVLPGVGATQVGGADVHGDIQGSNLT